MGPQSPDHQESLAAVAGPISVATYRSSRLYIFLYWLFTLRFKDLQSLGIAGRGSTGSRAEVVLDSMQVSLVQYRVLLIATLLCKRRSWSTLDDSLSLVLTYHRPCNWIDGVSWTSAMDDHQTPRSPTSLICLDHRPRHDKRHTSPASLLL